MLSRSKVVLRGLAWVLFFLAPFVLWVVHSGCGGDKSESRHTAVRAGSTRSASDVTKPGARGIDGFTAPGETAQVASTVEPSAEPEREVTYEEAEAAYLEGNYASAMGLFTRYTERKSENPWGYYMLGLSAWKAGELELAEKAFEKSLALDSTHVKSYLNLSRVLLDTQRPGEALEAIDHALAIDPESNVAYRQRGRALCQQGEIDEAIRAYQHALALNNQDAWAMNNLALIFIESERFDMALPPLARAVEIDSDVAVFWNNLGMALERTGRFRAAEEAYTSALDVDSSYSKASMNMTRVANVQEEPGLEPVDLGAVAQAFVEQVARWADEVAVRAEAEIMGPDEPSSAVPDSVVVRGDPVAGGKETP